MQKRSAMVMLMIHAWCAEWLSLPRKTDGMPDSGVRSHFKFLLAARPARRPLTTMSATPFPPRRLAPCRLLSVSIIPYIATSADDPDAIRDVPTDSQRASSTAAIYNLQGQRLGTPQRGVNIVGGKKIMVK